jgi:hypothetical protein
MPFSVGSYLKYAPVSTEKQKDKAWRRLKTLARRKKKGDRYRISNKPEWLLPDESPSKGISSPR